MSESEQSTKDVIEEPNHAHPDWYLQSLISIVNGKDIEFPITLFVNGLIVSGLLTSGHKYFESLGVQLTQFFGGPSEDTEKTVKYFTSPGDAYLEEKSDGAQTPPYFIHLRGAKVFTAGQQPIPSEGAWWRGRVASVNAFHFGSLAVPAEA